MDRSIAIMLDHRSTAKSEIPLAKCSSTTKGGGFVHVTLNIIVIELEWKARTRIQNILV